MAQNLNGDFFIFEMKGVCFYLVLMNAGAKLC